MAAKMKSVRNDKGSKSTPDLLIRHIPVMAVDNSVTLKPGDSVARAQDLMQKHSTGLVVVRTEAAIISGVITRARIEKAVAEWPARVADLTITHLFPQSQYTCTVDDRAQVVCDDMKSRGLTHIPVIHNQEVTGVVSYENIERFLSPESPPVTDGPWDSVAAASAEVEPFDHKHGDQWALNISEYPDQHEAVESFMQDDDFEAEETSYLEADPSFATSKFVRFEHDPENTERVRTKLSNHAKLLLIILLLGGVAIATSIIFSRPTIFETLGITEPALGVGLDIGSITVATDSIAGNSYLTVSGNIKNLTSQHVDVPNVKITLVDVNVVSLMDIIIVPTVPGVPPGDTVHFETLLSNPPTRARSMTVTFTVVAPEVQQESQWAFE